MDHPAIIRTERTGYPMPIRHPRFPTSIPDACDVCDTFEARVRFGRTRLCEDCAREEGIELL
jgi:hypothetical protein